MPSQKKKVTGAALTIMAATVLSRLTGQLREILVANIMKPKGFSDAYYAAFMLPDLMFQLLIGGAIAAALIPILSSYISKGEEEDGWKAAGTFINISTIAMVAVSILGIIFTPQLLKLTAPGFGIDRIKDYELTLRMTRILFPSVSFLMLAGLCNGVLNSYHKFTVAAFGPVIYNICFAFSILLFGSKSGELVAVGVMISSAIYFFIQLAFSMKHFKGNYKPSFFFNHTGFKKLLIIAIPSLIASSLTQINIMISNGFATFLNENRLTLLNMANKTWQLPLGIFAQSIGIAILPSLSTLHANDKRLDYQNTLLKAVKTVLMLAIPSTFGLMILNKQVIMTIFKWGSGMTAEDINLSGLLLVVYSVALIYQSMVLIMNRAFYSIKNTKIPLYTGTVSIVVNYILNIIFRNFTDFDAAGMALSYAIAVIINSFLLVFLFERKTQIDILCRIRFFLVKTIFSSLIMSGVIYLISLVLTPSINSKISQVLILGVNGILGSLVFLVLMVFLKVKEARYAVGLVISKIYKLTGK